jgi:O-antigen/teichoic acid export membrane protein
MKNSLILSIISALLIAVVQFFLNIDVAKNIGAADFGRFSMVLLTVGVVISVADLGYFNFFLKLRDIGSSTILFFYIISSTLIAFVILLGGWFSGYNELWMLMVYGFMFTLSQSSILILQKNEALWFAGLSDILAYLCGAIFYFFIMKNSAVYNYFYSMITVFFIKFIIQWIFIYISYKSSFPDKLNLSHYLIIGSRYAAWQVAERVAIFMSLRSEHFVINAILGSYVYGLYSFCWNFSSQATFRVIPIITRLAFVKFSKANELNERSEVMNAVLFILTIVVVPIFTILYVYSYSIVLFMGEDWSGASLLLSVLAICSFLRIFSDVINCYFSAVGLPHISTLWTIAWGGGNIIILYIFTSFYTLSGGLITSSFLICLGICYMLYYTKLGVLKQLLTDLLFVSLISVISALIVNSFLASETVLFVVISISLYLFLYFLVVTILLRKRVILSMGALN